MNEILEPIATTLYIYVGAAAAFAIVGLLLLGLWLSIVELLSNRRIKKSTRETNERLFRNACGDIDRMYDRVYRMANTVEQINNTVNPKPKETQDETK